MNIVPVFRRPEFWADYGSSAEYLERENYLLESLPPGTTSLLDVGCGNGTLVKRIEAAGRIPLAIGLDMSEAALRQGTFRSVVGGLPTLPFRDREFGVVVCLEVLEHIPDATYFSAVAELARVAREHIFIGVPYRENLITKTVTCASCGMDAHVEGHVRSYDERDLSGLIPGWILVSTALLGKQVIRIPDWLSRFRRSCLGHSYLEQDFVCPYCGGGRILRPSATRRRVVRVLGGLLVRVLRGALAHKPYWIIGRYRRAGWAGRCEA